MSKDLEIKLKLDRSQAKQATADHIADAKKMETATAGVAKAHKQSLGEVLADEQNTAKVKDGITQQTGRQRVASALASMKAEKATNDAGVAGAKAMGEASAASFGKITIGIETAKVGLRVLIDLAGGFGAAMKAAAAESKRLTGQFTSSQDKLGELATVMGEKADAEFTKKNAQFNVATGFKEDEGLAFRTQFHNTGEQYKGKTISDAEFSQFEQQSGQLIAAKGFDPDVSGDLAGSVIGFKDRTSMGDKASEDSLGKLNSGLSILGRGKGRNSVLVNQASMLSASSLNEDEMKGTFNDSDEVFTVISVMAEKHDAAAAEMGQAAIRGMRDFDGKAGGLLKKAKVNHQTKFIDAIKQIAPIVEQEAKDKNVKVEDVLKEHFDDITTRNAIGVAINRGVSGGLFDDRLQYGKANSGAAPALATIKDYQQSDRGMNRMADAQVKEAELGRGAENSEVEIIRKQALARLIQRKEINTTTTNMQDYIQGKLSFGMIGDGEQKRIDDEAFEGLNARLPKGAKKVAVGLLGKGDVEMPWTPEGREELMRNQMKEIKDSGGNPFGELVQVVKENNELLAKNNRLMEEQRPKPGQDRGPTVPPVLDPGRPPARQARP